ncbi:hypothetical protein [Kribbella sp. NPDC006257]|jgi:hypothetical protein|uniref:hypothetical protein n=1 Tax=Kribbella sp. NPDC006257 TaxID=3156738 RepID=UPI0033A77814
MENAQSQSYRNAAGPWTADEVAWLSELAADNFPPSVIGLRLGRPEQAVAVKAAQVGVRLLPDECPPYGGPPEIDSSLDEE